MAVSAVLRLGNLLAPIPIETKEYAKAHRRDALCPSPKIQKQSAFGMKGPYGNWRAVFFGLYKLPHCDIAHITIFMEYENNDRTA